jgi:hypothetical protein
MIPFCRLNSAWTKFSVQEITFETSDDINAAPEPLSLLVWTGLFALDANVRLRRAVLTPQIAESSQLPKDRLSAVTTEDSAR